MAMILDRHRSTFLDFSRQLLETRDIDPQYYCLLGVSDLRGLSKSDRYEFCCVYYGFNNIASADKFFYNRKLDPIAMGFGKNRRGFRGNRKVLDFIDDTLAMRRLIFNIPNDLDPSASWDAVYNAFLLARGCGPWSAYCLTEAMKLVVGLKITAPDFGDVKSSEGKTGPIAGLELLTGMPIERLARDKDLHRAIYKESLSHVHWDGLEQMESALCNYMSLVKGTYYVGRDIDRQIPALKDADPVWWRARETYFPHSMLGEKHGWDGPQKHLMGKFEMGKTWL